jgi:hypothetical protein
MFWPLDLYRKNIQHMYRTTIKTLMILVFYIPCCSQYTWWVGYVLGDPGFESGEVSDTYPSINFVGVQRDATAKKVKVKGR